MGRQFNPKDFYGKYSGDITCAYKEDIKLGEDGKEKCYAKRTQNKEKYTFEKLDEDVILIECPKDVLAIEFEKESQDKDKDKVSGDKIKEWIDKTCQKADDLNLDYCVADHGGTSPWFYMFNIRNLIEGEEKDCKKEMARKLVPKESWRFIDKSNFGSTLIPIINRPHWKFNKYGGAMHKLKKGKSPSKHKNKVPDPILQKLFHDKVKNLRTVDYKNGHKVNLDSINVRDVISSSSLKKRGNEYQGPNPWHGSSTGMNFCINTKKNVWHCFRHNAGGSVAKAIALNNNIISQCDESISKEDFKEVLEIAKEKYNLDVVSDDTEKSMMEAVQAITDKKQMAEQFWEIQKYFYDSSGLWWIWDKNKYKWTKVDDVDMLNYISKYASVDTITSKSKNEIIEALKQVGRKKKPKEAPNHWVQFRDKIIDLKNNRELKASPEYFITNPIPWELGESEETPTMDKIFEEWVGKEYKKVLYEIAAYCTIPNYPIHRLFCLVGEGRNGKSCYQRLVKKFIGNDNVTSTDLADLVNSRFEKAKLYKKLVCILGETNFSTISRTSLIKRLTGQDPVSFEFKRKDPIDGVNYSKILIATNGLPNTEDQSDGFYRRWCIVEFPNKFKGKKDILDDIPNEEYRNLARKSIRILKELLEKRKFHKEGEVRDRKKKYEELSNPVSKFIEEMCKKEGEIPFFKFYKEVSNFIENKNYRQMSKIEISKILSREGFEVKTKKVKKANGKQTTWKMVMGLSLDYGSNNPRYVVEKDLGNLYIEEDIKNKRIDDIIVENRDNKDTLEILEKEGYIRKLGGKNDDE